MGKLTVYDSEGKAMVPEGAESDRNMRVYFDQHVLAMQPNPEDGNPTIEIYVSVSTGERPEQVSIRYVGDDPSTILKDCRTAVKEELVEKRGWTIRRPRGTGPESLFWHAIWDQSTAKLTGSQTPEDLEHGLDSVESDIFESMPTKSSAPPGRINVSGYEEIAKVLPFFVDSQFTVVVSRPQYAPPSYADLHFSVSKTQRQPVKFHSDTKEYLQEQKQKHKEQRRRSKFATLRETVKELQELDTDSAKVQNELSTALDRSFSDLTVLTDQKVRQLKKKRANPPAPRSASSKHNIKNEPSSKSILTHPGFLMPIGLVLLISVGVIALGGFGLPFIDNGSGPGGSNSATNLTVSLDVVAINQSAFEINIESSRAVVYEVAVRRYNGSEKLNRTVTVNGTKRIIQTRYSPDVYRVSVKNETLYVQEDATIELTRTPSTLTSTSTPTPTRSPGPNQSSPTPQQSKTTNTSAPSQG